ncbi:alpha/beta-type small acid-soluble spore protein [Paenibacillus doosanensis]|uniref:Small, acid-soluble spore protein, alpha/beta type n=1 Tax=Paenibacillus konkukensis TaxID=2020716 RepID=A0ABY4RNN8_9BACL|nr:MULTISPECIES: small, acid-soluble spore protein, alpha/beta type [Paenibacillus]MCS7461791.1 alpha/beta-type small acid-soluble spore protein [Paenibacillus doosanensis]UQZ83630.1 Small, acid-soluble spore protein, alpha/beta type [Paenibacillus konkukensis]
MARRNRNRLVVPNASAGMEQFKGEVMRRQGYEVNMNRPDDVKYEVARSLGIPLEAQGGNGQLSTEQAGKIGGQIGGSMVKEMIRMAQQKLAEQQK